MANIKERIIKALSNTEQKPSPAGARAIQDGETPLGTLSPAAQGLYKLMEELQLEGMTEKAVNTGTKACGKTCQCTLFENRLHYVREFFCYIVAEEFGRVGNLSVDVCVDWQIVEVPRRRQERSYGLPPELERLFRGEGFEIVTLGDRGSRVQEV